MAHAADATRRACLLSPHAISALATAASASACAYGLVMERAIGLGLLELAGLGQRPGHRRQRLRPSQRVGDGAGDGLGLLLLAGLGPGSGHL